MEATSSYMDRYSKSIGLLNQVVDKSRNTVNHDLYDQSSFQRVFDMSEKLNGIGVKFPPEYNVVDLSQDMFYQFYKYSPTFKEDNEIMEENLTHKSMIEKAQQNENWQKLRQITKLDELNSAMASAFFTEQVLIETEKRDKSLRDKLKQMQEQRQQIMDKIQAHANASGDAQGQLEQEIQQDIQNLQQRSKDVADNISQIAVSQALKKTMEQTAEFNDTVNSFSWGNTTMDLQKVSSKERIQLANHLLQNKKLWELVKQLGRLKTIYIETRRQKMRSGTSEVYSITCGSHLTRVLPSELARLRHPVMKRDFFKRFIEGSLLEHELRGKETKGKGNMIVCLDLSGSMDMNLPDINVTREAFGKALALTCLEIAVREKRDYTLITFGSTIKETRHFDRKRRPSVDDVVSIAEEHYNEGTNFMRPVNEALKYSHQAKADILFLTDGECDVGKEWLAETKRRLFANKTKVIALQIGTGGTSSLEKFSDEVFKYEKLLETSKGVFQSLMEEAKP